MSADTPDYHQELEKKREKRFQKTTRREWIKYSLFGGAGFLASAAYLAFEAQWLEVLLSNSYLAILRRNIMRPGTYLFCPQIQNLLITRHHSMKRLLI